MLPSNPALTFHTPPPRILNGLECLLEAVEYADQTCADYWDFAVEFESLVSVGLKLNDFRWLVRTHLVEHQRETTGATDDGRAFRRSGDLTFPDRTCFVLTDKGIQVAKQVCTRGRQWLSAGPSSGVDCGEVFGREQLSRDKSLGQSSCLIFPVHPHWDADRRILQFNGTQVKHFKWNAQNQEAVLSAFEEEGWSSRIDDPLSPHPDQDPKRRLSDTIKCLNRKQDNAIVHFRGDGTGEGVVWEPV